jgi:hypothetical protein
MMEEARRRWHWSGAKDPNVHFVQLNFQLPNFKHKHSKSVDEEESKVRDKKSWGVERNWERNTWRNKKFEIEDLGRGEVLGEKLHSPNSGFRIFFHVNTFTILLQQNG